MASSTKQALASALKQMMAVKPIEKITIKDIVGICHMNRQTFYYHFDGVYDLLEWVFEEDANKALPVEIVYENWENDVRVWFDYLSENSVFVLNVYNSNSRVYMLQYIKRRLKTCIRGFADIVSEGMNIDKVDYEFIIEFYASGVVGLISQWLDNNMTLSKEVTTERMLRMLNKSIENMLFRFSSLNKA